MGIVPSPPLNGSVPRSLPDNGEAFRRAQLSSDDPGTKEKMRKKRPLLTYHGLEHVQHPQRTFQRTTSLACISKRQEKKPGTLLAVNSPDRDDGQIHLLRSYLKKVVIVNGKDILKVPFRR
mmetsp:Transcript_6104/g.25747  ORF Transcript_6104/g.25747 Transcript_6104/m.25747 type:complete len:121 (+) Transcript_6104:1285-1647(+)